MPPPPPTGGVSSGPPSIPLDLPNRIQRELRPAVRAITAPDARNLYITIEEAHEMAKRVAVEHLRIVQQELQVSALSPPPPAPPRAGFPAGALLRLAGLRCPHLVRTVSGANTECELIRSHTPGGGGGGQNLASQPPKFPARPSTLLPSAMQPHPPAAQVAQKEATQLKMYRDRQAQTMLVETLTRVPPSDAAIPVIRRHTVREGIQPSPI